MKKALLYVFLSLLALAVLGFASLFFYYGWQIKYGDAGKLAKDFAQDKFSMDSRLANSAGNAKVQIDDWQKYVRPANPVWGGSQASITVLVFIDFECPFSREAYDGFKQVMEKYAPVVKVVFKSLPLAEIHPNSLRAANAAACAGEQGKFWEYYDRLFIDKKLDEAGLTASAGALGLDANKFSACLGQNKYEAQIMDDMKDAVSLGVRGTPTYFVNGLKVEGVTSAGDWDKIILNFLQK